MKGAGSTSANCFLYRKGFSPNQGIFSPGTCRRTYYDYKSLVQSCPAPRPLEGGKDCVKKSVFTLCNSGLHLNVA